MKNRIKVAIEDIRFIKTQIQKILTTSRKSTSAYYSANQSNKSLNKKKGYMMNTKAFISKNSKEKETKYQSKSKENKSKSNSKSKKSKEIQTVFNSPVVKKQQFNSQAVNSKLIKSQKTSQQKSYKEENSQLSKQSSTKEIFKQWGIMEKHVKTNVTTPKNTTIPKQKEIIQELNYQSQHPTQIIVPQYIKKANNIRLRNDQDFLKQKYAYKQAKEESLKNKYKLLDERLKKIRKQFKKEDEQELNLDDEDQNNKKKLSASKKLALSSYIRYSPLNKFMKVNQKFRRQYQRNYSKQGNKNHSLSIDSSKPKWIK